ncbi:NACHT domain-containing protein [Micromonospora sp. DT43]|uniref:NACHT domain-containing protein n=1 Tax=Micromonospora sp. DT43 TaxID=3393440 RepID=UPI003CF042E3
MRRGQALTAVLAGLGVPGLLAVWKSSLITDHPAAAIALAVLWEVCLGLFLVLTGVAGRQIDRLRDVLDNAATQRLSGYGRRYREFVLSSLRYVDAKGLATVGDQSPELEEVFVELSLVSRAPHEVPGSVLADTPLEVSDRVSVWTVLGDATPRVLAVVGAPGCGKTTLLRHVARRLAKGRMRWRRPIPLLLILRDQAAALVDNPALTLAEVVGRALPRLGGGDAERWWEYRLVRGRCTVLMDGLDEVGRSQDRQMLSDWIDTQVAAYPRNDFVITSRPHGYQTAVVRSAQVFQVRPFTGEQVDQFVRGWYRAIERKAASSVNPAVDRVADDSAEDLLRRLASTPALYDLSVNPLLLTMIAHVHRYRSALPGSRADLYGEMCQVMLWRRHEAKRLPVEIPGATKERLLALLAYTMMCRRARDITVRQVASICLPILQRLTAEVTVADFLADVTSNGLLLERELDLYAFGHQTFQEYLAAKHIRDHGLGADLVACVTDSWWREATLLYLANADPDPIVAACLDAATMTSLSLAFEASETGGELAPDLRRRLAEIMTTGFEDGADPQRVRLVAGVLAARHLSQLIPQPNGTMLCPHPIPVNLYSLFLRGTGNPPPVWPGLAAQPQTEAVAGVWSSDAHSFVNWLNTLLGGSGRTDYRLPTRQELDGLEALQAPSPRIFLSQATSVWVQPDPGSRSPQLWVARGASSPRVATGAEVAQAFRRDIAVAGLLAQANLAAAYAVGKSLADRMGVPDAGTDLAGSLDRLASVTSEPPLAREFTTLLAFGARTVPFAAKENYSQRYIGTLLLQSDLWALLKLIERLSPPNEPEPAFTDMTTRALAAVDRSDVNPKHLEAVRREQTLGGNSQGAIDLIHEDELRRYIGTGLTRALGAVLSARRRLTEAELDGRFADALLRDTGFAGEEELDVELEALHDRALTAHVFFEGVDRWWAGPLAGRLVTATEQLLARRTTPLGTLGARVRLAAVVLAAEARLHGATDVHAALKEIGHGATAIESNARDPRWLERLLVARA